MKKLILSLALIATLAINAMAQSATPTMRFMPLLSGYNVLVPTNLTSSFPSGAGTYASFGQTNVLYTTYSGQTLYSLTNNTFFQSSNSTTITSQNTNLISGDAFKVIHLMPDVNGNFSSNAVLVIVSGYTNYEPWLYWTTNSQGQVTIGYGTNLLGSGTNVVYWPLEPTGPFPNWTLPATPNTYPTWAANTTNAVTVNLFRAPGTIKGGIGAQLGTLPELWETQAGYSVTTNLAAGVGMVAYIPIPLSFMAGAADVYCSVSVANIAGITATTNALINQIGIVQPQP